jgi:hypothetical protein
LPFPLYSGTTLAVRQEVGGSWSIALVLRKVARHSIPFFPRNFNSYGGSLLRPLDLAALYLSLSISDSSWGEMWWAVGFVSGVYVSVGMSSLWKMSLVNLVNFAMLISTSLVSFCLSMFQNSLGLYFRMSGSSNYSRARWCLQFSLNVLYASFVAAFFFPCLRFAYLYWALACRHDSSNHGAMCLAQRFGFWLSRYVWVLSTPAVFASAMRNSSVFRDRDSLS